MMMKLPDMERFICLFLAFFLLLPVSGREYDPGPLDSSDWRAIRGMASYARARYLIAEQSPDIDQISDFLKDSLIAMPESEIPLRLLLFLQQGKRDWKGLLGDLSAVVAAHPEHVGINVVYAECLAEARQADAACQHLLDFLQRTSWGSPDAVIRLLEIKADMGSWAESGGLLDKALRKKTLRDHPRLKIFQAYFLLRQAETKESAKQEQALLRRKAQALIQPFLEKPERLQDWQLFTSLFPVLAGLESWEQMNRLLDEVPADYPRTTFWFKNKLLALVKLQDVEGLNRLSREVFAATEMNAAVLEDIALAYIDVKEIRKAQEIYELLHLRNIQSLHYRLQLAWLYLLRGADSKGMALLAPVKELPFRGMMLKAEFFKMRQQHDQAIKVYQQAEKMALSSEDQRLLDPTFYVSFALAAEKAGQVELAIEKFRQAHQYEPDNPDLCNGLGYTLADHNQDLSFAEELIEKAVKASPDNIAFLDSLAWVRFRLNHFAGALHAMLKTLVIFQPGQDSDGVIHQHAGEIFSANEYSLLAELFQRKAAWERMTK